MFTTHIIPQLKDNYSYILIEDQNNIICVVDPSRSEPIIHFLEANNLQLNYILITHHHLDHIGGNLALKSKYGAKIIASKYDKDKISDIDILVEDNEEIDFLNNCKIIHTPGHTKGHISYYFEKEKILFCGDTLFSFGCGKIFEGTVSKMYNSIKRLANLPLDTKIYPGHEYTINNLKFAISIEPDNCDLLEFGNQIQTLYNKEFSTIPSNIENELRYNPFLRCYDPGIKTALNLDNSNDLVIFAELRRRKDFF